MTRTTTFISMLLAAALVSGAAHAQGNTRDRVTIVQRGGTTSVTGTVLSETWKGLELDKNGTGRADVVYEIDQVVKVDYVKLPRYLLDARLLRSKPKEMIAQLARAYNDDSTPARILQHAYYEIAKAYATEAAADATLLPKATEAYNKLFAKMPDTRYAVTGRIELGMLQLSLRSTDQAIATFQGLSEGGFGPAVTRKGRLLMARAQLSSGRYADAERCLTSVSESLKIDETEMAQEVKLLKGRSLVGQKKFDEAWATVAGILAANPSKKIVAMAYGVMGDYFAGKGDFRSALVAYLKVPLMYGDADEVEKAESTRQACEMLKQLGRSKDIELVPKSAGE